MTKTIYDTRSYMKKPIIIKAFLLQKDMVYDTLEGRMHGKAEKHYMVTGIKNESYFVRKDIFEETYELADDDNGL